MHSGMHANSSPFYHQTEIIIRAFAPCIERIVLEYCGVITPAYSFVNPSFPVKGQCIDFWLKMKRAAIAAFRAVVVLNFYLWGFVLNIINSIGYQVCFCLSRNFIWHFVVGRLPINACACIRIRTTSLPSSAVTLRAGLAESALARLLKRKRKADIIRRRRRWGGGSGAGGGIAHQGGQARHLYTPRTWEPNPDSSGDEAEVVYPEPRRSLSDLGSVNLVPQSALYQPVRSVGLVPEARGSSDPYGKGKSRAVSTSARPIRPILLGHLPLKTASDHNRGRVWWPGSSIIVWRWPVSFLRTSVVQGISFPRASASFLSPLVFVVRILLQQGCIRVWNHICGRLTKQTSLIKVEQDIPKLPGSAIVLDWHQVLDTDRLTTRRTEGVDTDGQIPHRHMATLTELSHLCQQSERRIHLVICNYLVSPFRNLEKVIHATGQSGLPVQLVLITTQRTGPKGKLAALRSVISGKFCLFDDNLEIIQEFSEASRPIAQVLKPRAHRSNLLSNILRQECIG